METFKNNQGIRGTRRKRQTGQTSKNRFGKRWRKNTNIRSKSPDGSPERWRYIGRENYLLSRSERMAVRIIKIPSLCPQ